MRFWIAVALVVGGCTGDDDGNGGPFVPITEFQAHYRDALCTHLVTCHQFADQATCLATNLNESLYLDPILVRDVLNGSVRYDGSTVATCFAALAARTCNPGDLVNRRPVEQCLLDVFAGTIHEGASCQLDDECISQVCDRACSGSESCCAGTCAGDTAPGKLVPLTSGTHCPLGTGMFDACAVGLYCDGPTSVCTAVKPEGAPCASTKECADGLQCDVNNTPNVCRQPPHLGDACTPSGQCGDEGTYCLNNLCTAYSLAGQPCLGQQCSGYTICDPASRLCVPYAAEGASCADTDRCNDVGTYCDPRSEICARPAANGAPCNVSNQCESGYCDTIKDLACEDPPVCP